MGVGNGTEFNLSLGPYTLSRLLSPKSPFHLVTELKNQSQLLVAVQDVMKPREEEGLSQAGLQISASCPYNSPALIPG